MKYTRAALLLSLILYTVIIHALQIEPLLFKKYPNLKEKVACVSLCDLPTPITKLEQFGEKLGYPSVYIKRDDLSGKIKGTTRLYGGNKPRKLEWLLADALQQGANTVVTYGCAGSNHALATAVYANECNLKTILMLKPQPNSNVVRQHLMLDYECNSELRAFSNNEVRDAARKKIVAENPHAYFIPTGGSTLIGTLGFVNAAFELQQQIQTSVIPEPHLIYLPIGSCATTAGLLLGMALNHAKTKVIAVAVEPEEEPEELENNTRILFQTTNEFLHNADNSIPLVAFPEHLFSVNKNFSSTAYGLWTREDALAIRIFKELEHITLEGTYSTKPVSAFIDDVLHRRIKNEIVLIWNTYCGQHLDVKRGLHSYKELPQEFHDYFEQDIQALDKITS